MLPKLIEIDDLRDGYIKLVNTVMAKGEEVSPRGMRTLEITDAVVFLKNPELCVPVGIGRKLNPAIGMAEALQLIAGVSDAKLMTNISGTFGRFVEYERLLGAYGPRVFHQISSLIRMLVTDPDTRQAELAIFRPDDIAIGSVDVPCTMTLRFSIRDKRLNMSTVMRSNDCVWGVTYDFWQFIALQHALSYALGVPVGTYTHHAHSMHVYVDRDQSIIKGLHAYDGNSAMPMPISGASTYQPRELVLALRRWMHVRNHARHALGLMKESASRTSRAINDEYIETLRPFLSGNKLCQCCRFVVPLKSMIIRHGNNLCRWCDKDRRYGLPIGTAVRMALVQKGKCAICGGDGSGTPLDLHLDHDHRTGVGRGLLCQNCNLGIANLKEDPELFKRATAYLGYETDANAWMTDFDFLYRTRPQTLRSNDGIG